MELENVPPGESRNDAAPLSKITIEDIRAKINRRPSPISCATVGTDGSSKSKLASKLQPLSSASDHKSLSPNETMEATTSSADQTRRRPGLQHKSTGLMSRNAETAERKEEELEKKYTELIAITEEILTYCHLLDNSRSRAIDETCSLRETIRELEKLLDSARQREFNHLSCVEQQREALAAFEKRYYSLKSRAKTHIKESQELSERYRKEYEACQQRLKTTETELYNIQSVANGQSATLERLREQTKNMPSEKEITQMRLQLRRLEDDNGRLATERAALMVQLDALTGKRDGQGAFKTPLSKREAELEDVIAELRQDKENLTRELLKARDSAKEYEQYCQVLLEKVPPEN